MEANGKVIYFMISSEPVQNLLLRATVPLRESSELRTYSWSPETKGGSVKTA